MITDKIADKPVIARPERGVGADDITRILLVDGTKHTRKSLALILGENGHEVETAESGREAVEKAREGIFNLALLDMGLPEMEGMKLFTSLRGIHPDMAVIILTDYISLETAISALSSGASAYITKPWDLDEVYLTISDVLKNQRLVVQNKRLLVEVRRETIKRQQAEERLRSVSLILKNAPVPIMIFNAEGIIEFVNPMFTQLTGYSSDRVLRTPVFDLGENTNQKNKEIWDVISSGHQWRGEILNRKENGEHYWVASSISPIQDAVGRITHFVEVHKDISERKRAEETIRVEKARTQQYLDIAGVGFIALDHEGCIALANKQSLVLLGYEEMELIGRNWFKTCLPERDRQSALNVFEKLMSGEVEVAKNHENTIVTRSGQERTVAWHTTLLTNTAGDIVGLLSSGEDITGRKQAEEEIRRSNRELTLLNQVIIAASSSKGPLSVFETTCRELALAFDVPQAAAALLDEKGEKLQVVAEYRAGGRPSGLQVEIPVEGNPATQTVLESKLPLAIADAQTDPRMAPLHELMRERGVKSLLIIPLVVGDRVVGTIGLDALERRVFTDEEKALGSSAAKAAAQVLESARLLEETRIRARHQETLNSIIAESVNATDLPTLLEKALTHTLRSLGMEHGAIRIAGLSWVQDLPRQLGQAMNRLIQSAREGDINLTKTLVVEDFLHTLPSSQWGEIATILGSKGIRACITVPITAEGQPYGWLTMAAKEARTWSREEVSLAEAIGQQLGDAAARLYLLQQTKEQAQRIQHIMDTVSEGLLLLDDEQKVALANPLAQEYLALLGDGDQDAPLEHLGNRPIKEFLGPPPKGSQHHELVVQEPSRRIFEVTANSTGTGPFSGGWALALRDVTEARWQQQYQQQKERLATVGQLAAGIAHDFNNIMAVIVLYSDILLKSTNLSLKTQERLIVINEQARHAARLTDQILSFSRSLVMEKKPVDLLSFVMGLVHLLERTLQESIGINLDYDDSDHFVNADITRLQQAFMNLALNARDAMPDGGSLKLDLRRLVVKTNQKPFVPDMLPGEWIRLIFSDTGTGISTDSLPHIFEPFFTTKSPGEGSGLGLAQVYGIVNQHDGHIDVVSKKDKGTTFTIYLPAAVLPRTGPLTPIETGPFTGGQETLLLVEDSEATGTAVKVALEGEGYSVLQARDGREALTLFDEHADEISLVITDLVMPGMGGEALNGVLQEKKPGLKVIVITGYMFDGGSEALAKQGVSAWLQKPFTMDMIAHKVRKVLDM
ncbi:MAG: response regulator [Candidatus Promineifilaceae bacterium]